MVLVSEIIAYQNVAINCLYLEENNCYRQSIGYQTVLRFCISHTAELSSQGSISTIKVLSFRLSAPLPCYLLKGPLKRDFLDIYVTMSFGVCNFKNASPMRVIFFFENGQNCI